MKRFLSTLIFLLCLLSAHCVNPDSLALTNRLSVEGMKLYKKGNYKAAEAKFRQALAIDTALFMGNHYQRIIYTGMWLGNTLCRLGRTQEALDGEYTGLYCFADPVDFRKMEAIDSLGTLGQQLLEKGDYREGYKTLKERQVLLDAVLPHPHIWNGNNKYLLAEALRRLSYNEQPQAQEYVGYISDYLQACRTYYSGKGVDDQYMMLLLQTIDEACNFRFLFEAIDPKNNELIAAIHTAENLFVKSKIKSYEYEFAYRKALVKAYSQYVSKAMMSYKAEQAGEACKIFATLFRNYDRQLAICDSLKGTRQWTNKVEILENIAECYSKFSWCNMRGVDTFHNDMTLYDLSKARTQQDSLAMQRVNMLDALTGIVGIMNTDDPDSIQYLHERYCHLQSIEAIARAKEICRLHSRQAYLDECQQLANYFKSAKMFDLAAKELDTLCAEYEDTDHSKYIATLHSLAHVHQIASVGAYDSMGLAFMLAWDRKVDYAGIVRHYYSAIATYKKAIAAAEMYVPQYYALAGLHYQLGELYFQKAQGTKDTISALKAIECYGAYLEKSEVVSKKDTEEIGEKILKCKAVIGTDDVMEAMDASQRKQFEQDLHTLLFAAKNERVRVMEGNYAGNVQYAHDHRSIPHAGIVAYDASLFNKGILLGFERELQTVIAQSANPKIKALNKKLEEYTKSAGADNDSTREMERQILELCRQEENLNGHLSKVWQDVKNAISKHDLAIEFYKTPSGKYGAAVLSRTDSEPILLPLFDETDLMSHRDDYFSAEASAVVWQKLIPYMRNKKNVYFAADGELHNIPIEYMPMPDGKAMLLDKWQLHRLTSTRELTQRHDATDSRAAVYGGLQYSLTASEMQRDAQRYPQVDESRSVNMAAGLYGVDRAHSGVSDLKYTKIEASEIYRLLDDKKIESRLYSDSNGTETSFKNLNPDSTNIIHIATHGFYLTKEQFKRFVAAARLKAETDGSEEEYALIRSGLYFAGVNNVLKGRAVPTGVDDGILTAKEISMMNFRHLDLVVLSACQTALGDIGSDGVFGLQRGFKMAGAQTLLMSLWKVDDRATQMLMKHFYAALLGGKSKTAALHYAQKCLREYTVESSTGVMHPYQAPKYWAAFILLDDIAR